MSGAASYVDQDALAAWLPALDSLPGWKRRDVLRFVGGAIALAGLDGCERGADGRAMPYVDQPEGETIGRPRFYATAVEFDGVAQPVVGTTRSGRPIKLEGNPDHPASGGKSDAFTQAALLGLYDPARSRTVRQGGRIATWAAFDAAALDLRRRLDAGGGAGFRLLTGPIGSPTLLRLIAAMLRRWPVARWHAWSPVPPGRARRLEQAHAIVSFDDDLLGSGPLQTWHARGWAARRIAYQRGDGEALLMVAEPTPTLTGIAASERLIAAPSRLPALLGALAGDRPAGLEPREQAWLGRAAAALRRNPGRGLVSVGIHHSRELRELADGINRRLGNPADRQAATTIPQEQAIEPLLADIGAGQVATLAILDTNPAYGFPGFAEAIAKVPLRLHAGLHADETAIRCHWHTPLAHDLESWSDGRAADGSSCLVQPLVRPWLDVRAKAAWLAGLLGEGGDDHALVRQTWAEAWGVGGDAFERRWAEALVGGIAAAAEASPGGAVGTTAANDVPKPEPADPSRGPTLLIRPDPTVWDGRFAANPWLQELPKPVTKIVWGNAIHLSPALAEAMDLAEGEEVELAAGGRSVIGPAWIVPGQQRDTVVIHLGYGRRAGAGLADGLGFDAASLGPVGARIDGVTLRKTGGRQLVATTQSHFADDGAAFVRLVSARGERLPPRRPQPSAYRPLPKTKPSWGMAIDLDLCTGCNACVAACTAENNVPTVGKEQVAKGRAMHWLRIDRYQQGPADDPRHVFQPVPCMHCEDAPCEMGCPVNAAVHSPDGLNLQVYNRCIGTRTCAAYCPYKVRRFNWFDFTGGDPDELRAARNPEVTVRARGVMEKCTYCVQRLQNARIDAEVDGRSEWAADVQTACQQACPTQAIVFGDISDPASPVSRRKAGGRDYDLLPEANTRPRTTYAARIAGGEAKT